MTTNDQKNVDLNAVMRSLVAIIPAAKRKAWTDEIAEAARAKNEPKTSQKKDLTNAV